MERAWQPEALQNRRLEQLRATMDDYIAKNIEQIEGNLPVFFGHVAATLDRSFPDLDDRTYDDFIDETGFALLNAKRGPPTPEFLEKVLRHAVGNKKEQKGRATLEVMVALNLIDIGSYYQALEYLSRHRNHDIRINAAIAYCYYALSLAKNQSPGPRPDDMELQAREEMLTLALARPPLSRLGPLDRKESRLNSVFWYMLDLAFTWFPSEPAFYRIGIAWTKHVGDAERRLQLLDRATEHFANDRYFLAEAFNTSVDLRNGSGAASIVKQMMQQFPDDHEPLYYGMKLAILGGKPGSYARFRKLAIRKEFPRRLLLLLDTVLEVMCNHRTESLLCFEEVKKASMARDYYLTALEYILRDFVEEDEERAKRARSTFFSSVDLYCMQTLKIAA